MEDLIAILALVLFFAGIVVVFSKGISNINYLIDDRYVRIRIGSMRVRKFEIEDIRDAQVGTVHGVEAWTNTIHRPTIYEKGVTLFRRTGMLKKVVITPDDPTGFVERIKTHPRFSPQ